jgi:hypothetical protein
VFLSSSFYVQAASSGLLALIYAKLTETEVMNVIRQVANIFQYIETAYNTYETLMNLYRAEERALKNLRSIVDIRSVSDFVNWQNRVFYLGRQEEQIYSRMGVNIDGKRYGITDIDKIPEAMKNDFKDNYRADFSEEDQYNMFTSLGMTPSNYLYMKTWQQRNDAMAKQIRTYREIHADEAEDAAARNQNIISKYQVSGEELDANEIAKEAHITAMNQEMLLRELIQITIGMKDYELSRDKLNEIPPTPPQQPYGAKDKIFGDGITEGRGRRNYSRF